MKLRIIIDDAKACKTIAGVNSENLKALEEVFEASIDIHGDSVLTNLTDEIKIEKLETIFTVLKEMALKGFTISLRDVYYVIK